MRKHKYGAIPKVIDNIRFASSKEARRYQELKLLLRAGEIRGLKLQPKFPLYVRPTDPLRDTHVLGTKVCDYVADFEYEARDRCFGQPIWKVIIEDAKGMLTPMYRLKKRMMYAQYGIEIREI